MEKPDCCIEVGARVFGMGEFPLIHQLGALSVNQAATQRECVSSEEAGSRALHRSLTSLSGRERNTFIIAFARRL